MNEFTRITQAEMPYFFYIIFFVLGACIGSFLNVCIYRIPKDESIVKPRSHCKCGALIPWYNNIPILSWFILGGKCKVCKCSFSFRYPLIEAITALLFVLCWTLLSPTKALIGMLFTSLLIVATFIDLDHMYIPDRFTIGGFVIGLLIAFFIPSHFGFTSEAPFIVNGLRSLIMASIGGFVGSGLILWIGLLTEKLLSKETMGFGDVKFMGCIGAFCGWQGTLFAIFGGALFGTMILIPLIIFKKLKNRATPIENVVPFGPWLALGALIYFLLLKTPIDNYLNTFKEILFMDFMV